MSTWTSFTTSTKLTTLMFRAWAILISPFNNSSKGMFFFIYIWKNAKIQWKPSKTKTSCKAMMLALAISHVDWSAYICIMSGLYFANTLFARKNIDNHCVFTFWWIFKPFTFDKATNLSSSKSFLARLTEVKIYPSKKLFNAINEWLCHTLS